MTQQHQHVVQDNSLLITTTAVAPLPPRDADALVVASRRAAEAAGVTNSITVLDSGSICSPSGGTTGPC